MTNTKTVLVTEEAKAAARRIKTIVDGGLAEQVADLQRQGKTLAGGAVWKGARAEQFTGSIWPEADAALAKLKPALDDLHRWVDTVLDNIFAAGNA
ncbi:MAG: hypothetical protein QOF60_863 [Actinomycetota bacterium]|jgi:hypothetical protein|nr:hypothetical protein [Actinomycetota bacterium]